MTSLTSLYTLVRAALAATVIGMSSGCALPRSTDSDEIGVKYCKFWCGKEKVELVSPGRTVFVIPLKNEWYTLSSSMQSLDMTLTAQSGDRKRRDDLMFKTIEGNDIGQDIIMTWRLDHIRAGKIIEEVGADMEAIKERYVRPIARSVIRDFFNRLHSTEFYESQRRFEVAHEAKRELARRFAPYGILVDDVNPKEYRFIDPKYQYAINDAKNAGQDREKYIREIESQRQLWKKKLEEQRGTSNEQIAAADGKRREAVLNADADYIKNDRDAAAIRTEKKAQAEAATKLRQAMASRGGDTAILGVYVQNFNPDEIVVLPCDERGGGLAVNRLDLNALIAAEAARASQPAGQPGQ